MNLFKSLDNVIQSIEHNDIKLFKIGFVGNGEALLDYELPKEYILYITKSDSGTSGPVLAKAYMELGELLGNSFAGLNPDDTIIVAMLRGSLFLQKVFTLD